MRLDHPILTRLGMLAATFWFRLVHATTEVLFEADDPRAELIRSPTRNIYVFWHEMMILPAYLYAPHATILISRHRDGDLIAHVVRLLRGHCVRGSSRRGGAASVRQMIRQGRLRHLAVTPDGPRGPRRVVQQGVIYIASRTGMPIVPVGIDYSFCRRAQSWDRMAVPWPMGRARVVGGKPIRVPAGADRDEIDRYRVIVQKAMDDVQARAEALAAGGRPRSRLMSLAELKAPDL